MNLNGDIIRQLYYKVTSEFKTDTVVEKANNGFVRQTTSDKPICLKAFYRFFYAVGEAFPDYKLLLDNIVVKENRVMAHYTISGTQKGNFMGLEATDEPMAITGIDIFRLNEGQIVEYWEAAHQLTAVSKQTRNLPNRWHPGNVLSTASEQKQLTIHT